MSPSEFEFLIHVIGGKSKKGQRFWKTISVQGRLSLSLRFFASGDSYVSLQHLFRISKQTISCIVPEVCAAPVEKLKYYVQVRQILSNVFKYASQRLQQARPSLPLGLGTTTVQICTTLQDKHQE
jgi:hypothetical protein